MTDKEQFLFEIDQIIKKGINVKIILSKPRPGNTIRSTSLEAMDHNDELCYKLTEKTLTQHFTKVVTTEDLLPYLEDSLNQHFYYCELHSEGGNGALLQNQKGTSTFVRKKGFTKVEAQLHNKSKNYIIPPDAAFLIRLGISSSKGKVFEQAQHKYRQINKFIEVISNTINSKHQSITIADLACGKAYLTFAVYYYFSEVLKKETSVLGYEIRKELVDDCNTIASDLKYNGLRFGVADIQDIQLEKCDAVIALHACDIATDLAIYAGIKSKVKYMILSPCCHKQIRKQIFLKDGILKHGILLERTAEIVTDALRALILEDQGYKAKVFEFISSEHTSKNIMITAVKNKKNINAGIEIKDIKENYGIRYHYLEKLLNENIARLEETDSNID